MGIFVQTRYLLDATLPLNPLPPKTFDWIWSKLKGISGQWEFIAEFDENTPRVESVVKDNIGHIDGSIYVFKGFHNKSVSELGKSCMHSERSFEKDLSQPIAKLNQIRNDATLSVNFRLYRSGEVHIECSEFLIEKISQTGDFDAIISQAFYFLRDLCHNHQHHDPKNDTIVYLYADNWNYKDNNWEDAIYYSIYRKIIRFKRKKSESSLKHARGLIAYAESFKLSRNSSKKLKEYNISEIRESIESASEAVKLENQRSIYRATTMQTFIVALATLIIAVIGIANIHDEEKDIEISPIIDSFSKFLVESPIHFIIIVFLLYFTFAVKNKTIELMNFRSVRNLARTLQHLNYDVFLILTLIGGPILMITTIYLILR